MQRIFAISWLTVKAAFRFRLIWILTALLLGGVVILPILIKDDGTARGFTQIVLTYTLSLITCLLGLATLWLACGAMARDIQECQMQMVAVKPIARWQIWLGKYLGILAVNILLLAVSGAAVFFLLQWRARRLPPDQQQVLRNEVLVARGSFKPPTPNFDAEVEAQLKELLKRNPQAANDLDLARQQIRERLKAAMQAVMPDYRIEWKLRLGLLKDLIRDKPLQLRVKFQAADAAPTTLSAATPATYRGAFVVGGFESPRAYRTEEMSLSANTFHELRLPPNLVSANGDLAIDFINRSDSVLLFPLDEGIEVLYREGGFALNFARGLAIIFLWISLLAAIGLAASSFLSFPVAAFCAIGILIVGFSSGTISEILQQGTILEVNHDTGRADHPAWIDYLALPVFKGVLEIITLVRGFSPIDSLSSGRSVSWWELLRAFFQIFVVMGGVFAAVGIVAFSRRELATAQGTS